MFSVSQLLNPISASNPCGEDLSFSSEIDAISEARRFDDPSLDQGEWVTKLKEADWPFVVQQCSSLIELKSKDLRLAVWLTEASAKIAHFRGLGDGCLLIAGLCDQYWDGLYPLADDNDQEQRIGNLSWLLVRAAQLVREMPLTEGKKTAYSTIDFEAARLRAANSDKSTSEEVNPDAGVKLADIETARRKSSRGFYEKMLDDSKYCLDAVDQLEKSVDARLGIDGPGFSAVKEALSAVIHTVTRFAQDAGVVTQRISVESPTQVDAAIVAPSILAVSGEIQTRAQALNQLRQVAEFFRRTEPHSPVGYLADKAANWGEIPLHTWLKTVIKDAVSLAHVEELLGMEQKAAEPEE